MTVHLPEDLEQFLRSEILRGRFASEEHAISEAVRLLQQRNQEQVDPVREPVSEVEENGFPDRTRRQHDSLRRLCQTLEAMPTALVTDGLNNRDHDLVLYGQGS